MICSSNGIVKVLPDCHYSQFSDCLKNPKGRVYPVAMSGIGNGHLIDLSVYLSNEVDTRLPPKNENQVAIHYLSPFGEHPNCLRLFFTPNWVKNRHPNFGIKASTKSKLT